MIISAKTAVDLGKPIDHRAVAETFLAMARGYLHAAKVNVSVAEALLTGRVPETVEGIQEAAIRADIAESVRGMVR